MIHDWLCSTILLMLLMFQAPGDPSKVPVQLKLERQNQLLRLQHEQDKIQTDFNSTGCQEAGRKANADYMAKQAQIDSAEQEGLKEIGLDPAKYIVQPGTFYVGEKPAPPAAAPAPAAKAEPKK